MGDRRGAVTQQLGHCGCVGVVATATAPHEAMLLVHLQCLPTLCSVLHPAGPSLLVAAASSIFVCLSHSFHMLLTCFSIFSHSFSLPQAWA
jgi:hypothetical protein